MASDTATKRLKAAQRTALDLAGDLRRLLISRLGATIIVTNLAALSVLVAGIFAITENRRGLVEAKLDSLTAQAEIIASIITETAVSGDAPGPVMDRGAAREVLRRLSSLYVPEETRALLYAPGPVRIADSDLIAGEVEQSPLPPPGETAPALGGVGGALDRAGEWFGALFLSRAEREALERSLIEEVEDAFQTGELQAGVRRGPDGRRVVSVTVPVQLIQAVVGTVTYESYDLDALVAAERAAIRPYVLIAAVVTFFLAVGLTVNIAWPVRRLAEAAREVRLAGGRRVPLPDMKGRRDEIGDLGRAFNQMTNALYDRLDAIESFAADVAHEIKNPLTSIRSAAETLPLAQDEEKRARLLAVIQHDVRRLDRLITDISNASRLDAELAREDLDLVDLGRLAADIAVLHDRGAEGAPAGPRIDVKAGPGPYLVRGHEGPLGRVLINLIDNAVTFSPPGGRVTIALQRLSAGRIILSVEDNGPGVPEENLEAIFERFYTQRPEGAAFGSHSGLGLAITRQIVSAHGGRIRAENRPGPNGAPRGARFIVELPAAGR